jgi:hypothetical protein
MLRGLGRGQARDPAIPGTRSLVCLRVRAASRVELSVKIIQACFRAYAITLATGLSIFTAVKYAGVNGPPTRKL